MLVKSELIFRLKFVATQHE